MTLVADVADVNPRSPPAPDGPVGFIGLKDLDATSGELRPLNEVDPGTVRPGLRTVLRNDVIVAAIEPALGNGKVAVADHLPNGFAFATTELVVLRPREGIEPFWLWSFLRRAAVRDVLRSRLTGTTRRRVRPDVIAALAMSDGAVDRMQEVVEVVGELQLCLARRAEALDLLSSLPGAIVAPYGTRAKVPLGAVLPSSAARSAVEGGEPTPAGVPVIQAASLRDGRIEAAPPSDGRPLGLPLESGDLLVPRSGRPPRPLTHSTFYDGRPAGAAAGSTLIRVRVPVSVDAHWLWAWLRSLPADAPPLHSLNPAGRSSLGAGALLSVRIPEVDIAEQRRLGALLREARLIAERAAEQRDAIVELREAFLDGVFGRVASSELPEPAVAGAPLTGLTWLRERLAPEQLEVWDLVASAEAPQSLSALTPGRPGAHEETRRTLELLERMGAVMPSVGADGAAAWRGVGEDDLFGDGT